MNEQEIVEQFIKWMLANKWYICIWDKNFSWYMRDRILPEELARLFIEARNREIEQEIQDELSKPGCTCRRVNIPGVHMISGQDDCPVHGFGLAWKLTEKEST